MMYPEVDKKLILETFQNYVELETQELERLFRDANSYIKKSPLWARVVMTPLINSMLAFAASRGDSTGVAAKLVKVTLLNERNPDVKRAE